jgi:hypothetical protein
MKTYRRILAQLPASCQSVEEQITDLTHIRKPCTGFQAATTPRPARRNRRFPSRPTKLVAVGAALITMAASHAAVVSTASLDFLGNFQAGTLVAGDVAGVVPANQWGAATGNIGFLPQFDTLGSDVINFNWNAPDSAVIPGNVPTPGDNLMMEGYITSGNTSVGPAAAGVRVSSIDLGALGWSYYDVFVYSDTGMNGPTTSISLSAPGTTTYSHTESVPGFGVGGFNTYLDSQVSPAGNYVRYNGLTANMFDVTAVHIPGAGNMAAINGIQLVGHKVPEPSTGLLAILSTTLLVMRRKRS